MGVLELIDAQGASRARVEQQALAKTKAAVVGFDEWYSDEAAWAMAQQVAQIVESSQRATAALTDTYQRRYASQFIAGTLPPTGVSLPPSALRDGIYDTAEAYERLAANYRWSISQGAPHDVAVTSTLDRLDAMVRTDVQLAGRWQSRSSASKLGATGYRRAIHPELSTTGVCGLCVAASIRTYGLAKLLPIHDRCKCEVLPVYDRDGHAADEVVWDAYDEAIARAGDTDGAALKSLRFKVADHGELGPVLRMDDHRALTPAQVQANLGRSRTWKNREADTLARARRSVVAIGNTRTYLRGEWARGVNVSAQLARLDKDEAAARATIRSLT